MIRSLQEIGVDASNETLREQIAERRDFLPRCASPRTVRELRREIAELEHRLERRGP